MNRMLINFSKSNEIKKAIFSIMGIIFLLSPLNTLAISENDLEKINLDTTFYDESDLANSACTEQGAEVLDGHKLPATKGGTGYEDPINEAGQIPGGGTVTWSRHARLGQEYRDYYINMRWDHAKWFWNGDATDINQEKYAWYNEKPRKVLVTNPRTKKSIIAAVVESGPAPWTGVDGGKNNEPKQGYVNPMFGTPAEYKGRVSGMPPTAYRYLGAAQRMADGSGDDLLYSWAPDQNAKPGPVTTSASTTTKSTVVIGDSISVGMRDYGELKQKLSDSGWKSTIDASGGRSIATAGSTDAKTSGLKAVQDNKDKIKNASVVVVQLGTNRSNDLNQFRSLVKDMAKDIKQINSSAKIVWVNIFSQVPQKESYNNALQQLAQTEDFTVLDVTDKNIELDSDNTHATAAGYKKLSTVIVEGINSYGKGDANCEEIGDANIIQYKPRMPTSGKIRPTAIILHWWGFNAAGNTGIQHLVNGLKGNRDCGPSGCSVQLGILRDGKTYQLTNSLTSRALHAVCANEYAIGIEIEGTDSNFGATGPEKRPEQFKAVVATVKYLMEKYDIPLESTVQNPSSRGAKGVVSHKQIDARCPSGSGKPDVDDAYLQKVKEAIKNGQ